MRKLVSFYLSGDLSRVTEIPFQQLFFAYYLLNEANTDE